MEGTTVFGGGGGPGSREKELMAGGKCLGWWGGRGTPEKEADLGHGSGCLRWVERHPGKGRVENKSPRSSSYLQWYLAGAKTPLALLGLGC